MSVNDVVELGIKSDSEQLGISLPKEWFWAVRYKSTTVRWGYTPNKLYEWPTIYIYGSVR
jgi:hypothetical protein